MPRPARVTAAAAQQCEETRLGVHRALRRAAVNAVRRAAETVELLGLVMVRAVVEHHSAERAAARPAEAARVLCCLAEGAACRGQAHPLGAVVCPAAAQELWA